MPRLLKNIGLALCLISVSVLTGSNCFAGVSAANTARVINENVTTNSKVDNSYAGLRLNHGAKNVVVDIFPGKNPSECRILSNNDAENDYFVPAGSLDEWHSFISNKPGAITIGPCAGVCGPANGRTYSRISDINASDLCSSGTSSVVSDAGGFSWSCTSGSSAVCSARKSCSNLSSLTSVESCPSGQTGSITYSQDYYCPSGYEPGSYGSKIQTSNSCISTYTFDNFDFTIPKYTCTSNNSWTYGFGGLSFTYDTCGNSYSTTYLSGGMSITSGSNGYFATSYTYGSGYISTYSSSSSNSLSFSNSTGYYNSSYGGGGFYSTSGNVMNGIGTYGLSYYSGQGVSSSWGIGSSIYSWW